MREAIAFIFWGRYLLQTDDDGGVGTDTLIVTVNNVAPSVNEDFLIYYFY